MSKSPSVRMFELLRAAVQSQLAGMPGPNATLAEVEAWGRDFISDWVSRRASIFWLTNLALKFVGHPGLKPALHQR
jgi:hypothetical protein